MPDDLLVRPRRADDLPILAAVLSAQQPHSGYPQRWPLPWPVEQFIERRHELGAWVAEVGGRVVGHVAVTGVEPSDEATGWSRATGRPLDELACVAVLFVDHTLARRGVGSSLLTAAVDHIRGLDRVPVLDVVQESPEAVRLYERHGWQAVGEARPVWLPDHLRPVLLMVLPDDVPQPRQTK
jgi:ribosomal protein S18 acetylase RimI-like enzyme